MAWYNSAWAKRKELTLTGGPSGAQTDYQIKLTIAYDSNMQSDFDDLRFTDSDGTLVDAWLEDHTASTSATVWVEFPTTPANGVEQTYYMYYGNSGASSTWSGADTFLQYHGVATSQFIDTLVVTPTNIAYEAKCKVTAATHNIRFGLSNNVAHSADDSMGVSPASSGNLRYGYVRNESVITYKSESPTFTTDVYYRVMATLTDSVVATFVDGNPIGTGDITTNLPNETLGLGMETVSGSGAQDWSFARKYVTAPATYGFGSVEWNSGAWPKRQKITLTGGTDGAQTDYQIKLTIPYDSDMKSDFSDLRFTTSAGDVLIDAWLETSTVSTSAAVWVEFPTTPASAATEDYYMYYGNSGASSDWNGSTTFPDYFDDFSSDTISNYTERHYATWSVFAHKEVTGGELHIGFDDTTYGSAVLFHTASALTNSGYAMRSHFRASGYHSDVSLFRHQKEIGLTTDTTPTYVASCGCNPDFVGWHSDGCINMPDNHCQTTNISGVTTDEIVYSLDGSTYYPGFWVQDISSASTSSELWVDWAFVRKSVTNPATYVFGSEEPIGPAGSAIWYYRLLQVRRN